MVFSYGIFPLTPGLGPEEWEVMAMCLHCPGAWAIPWDDPKSSDGIGMGAHLIFKPAHCMYIYIYVYKLQCEAPVR